jgi:uncharacterized protein YbjQ (UPF0145 family)
VYRVVIVRHAGFWYNSGQELKGEMMTIVNTETIPGKTVVEVKGLVQGNTVRAKNIGRDIAAGFKNMVGGELKGYTELLTESRREAMTRMIAQAEALGANAVVNVRFSTSAITSGASEMMAYGTAVVAE